MDHIPIIRQADGNRFDRRPLETDSAGNVEGRARDLGILPLTFDLVASTEIYEPDGLDAIKVGGQSQVFVDRAEGLWGLGIQERPPVGADVVVDETEFVFCETTATYGPTNNPTFPQTGSGIWMRVLDTNGDLMGDDLFDSTHRLLLDTGTRGSGTFARQPFNFQLPMPHQLATVESSLPVGRVEMFAVRRVDPDGTDDPPTSERVFQFDEVRVASTVRGWVDRPNNNFRAFGNTARFAIPFSAQYWGPAGWLLGVWPVPYGAPYRLRVRASGTARGGGVGWKLVFSTNNTVRADEGGNIQPSSFQVETISSNPLNVPFTTWTYDDVIEVGPVTRPRDIGGGNDVKRWANYIMVQLVGDETGADNRIDCDLESIEFVSPNYPQVYGA